MESKKATTVTLIMKTVCGETKKWMLQFPHHWKNINAPSWATTLDRSFFGITIQVLLSIKLFSVFTVRYIQSEICLNYSRVAVHLASMTSCSEELRTLQINSAVSEKETNYVKTILMNNIYIFFYFKMASQNKSLEF